MSRSQLFRACLAIVILAPPFVSAPAQSAQQWIDQVVATEHAADENDHSRWIYLEEIQKPKEHVLQWVASTQEGDVRRVLRRDNEPLNEAQQRELIDRFLHDSKAQKKQIAESEHDNRQIDDLLQLLPVAFVWTQVDSNEASASLHFEPAPHFHPPTREARVFSSMAGDVIIDKQQHRIRKMTGHLTHEVNFGGGLLGKLKEGSSFSLEQEQVGPHLWQLTRFHVDLEGNALLFKSISLQEDDERSQFKLEPSTVTLVQAASGVVDLGPAQEHIRSKP